MKRIHVVGSSGSGKTTLAHTLARELNLTHIELDALYWGPNWQARPQDEVRARIVQAIAAERWSIDGNYNFARDLIWARADTVVWLEYPLRRVLWQLARRTSQRMTADTPLWNGNRETLRGALFSRDSLFVWAITSRKTLRERYAAAMQSPEFAHIRFVHLRSPRETLMWLASLGVPKLL